MVLGVAVLAGAALLACLLLSTALAFLASGSPLKRAAKGGAAGCGLLLFPLAVLAAPLFVPLVAYVLDLGG
ncbi:MULTISPECIES: hypothetical protein [Kitasatospora]|uniref:Uncharacterized protein n=1 Tax=Kitasatospora setae (strain ATCC 33774 / DSM 43861 / JCM 3304 / KCC A-0304 / NBRC 14216 / KM-6054) TaxID=452652 RepID=E4N765_KITSK|nr:MULTISPECIES: hypothetical protein [Kitasatospora]BAJ27046.1 hypothetical protein KSE_12130 [Kitasatospora setae KM-6054]